MWDAKLYQLHAQLAVVDRLWEKLNHDVKMAAVLRARSRNAYSTLIGRLPNTVLADIFVAGAEPRDWTYGPNHALLVAITGTSHRWRELAINSP